MNRIRKITGMAVLVCLIFVGLMIGGWYRITTASTIHPTRGIYGMEGIESLEIWIEINRYMPNAARQWACDTLLARETAVTKMTRPENAVPYSCQHDFGTRAATGTPYDTIVDGNLRQFKEGLSPEQEAALKTCFEAKMAASVTPEQIAATNDSDIPAMKAVVGAASISARECRAEVAK